MIMRTIERMRRASAWIFNPTRLIDRLLDELEQLSVVFQLPAQSAGLSRNEARFD